MINCPEGTYISFTYTRDNEFRPAEEPYKASFEDYYFEDLFIVKQVLSYRFMSIPYPRVTIRANYLEVECRGYYSCDSDVILPVLHYISVSDWAQDSVGKFIYHIFPEIFLI